MKTIVTVPLSSLTISGEGGESVTPEKGDMVTVNAPGRFIEAIGQDARVEIGADESEEPAGEEQMEKELEGMYEQSQQPPPM